MYTHCCADVWSRSSPAVICTLGPACRSVDTLEAMINAGMSAARVDLTVRAANAELLCDL
jgi:Pyruvate kinase, barrel domain